MRISDWSSDVCSSDLPRDREPFDQRLPQLAADLVVIAAQRDFLLLDIVIGIARADRAPRRFDLRDDEFLVIVDIAQRLRGVRHAPHDLRRPPDRVATEFVDLDLLRTDYVPAQERE